MSTEETRPGPQTKPRVLLLLGALACFALGAATMFLLQSRSAPDPTSAPSGASSRRGTHAIDSESEPLLATASPAPRNEAARNALAEVQQLLHAVFEEQMEITPVTSMLGQQIVRREDKTHIFYDVPIEGLKREDLRVQVGDGLITISGKMEKADLFSSFKKSFSIPEGVDANRARILPEADKLVIEFPKRP